MRMGTPLAFAKACQYILISSYLAGPILFPLLVLRFGVCICSSSSSSHSNQESNYCFNCDKQSFSYFPCSKRFAVESYFREYDNLVDSNLIEYVARKVNFGSDKAFSRLVELKRHLIGEGSHRHLSSSVRISVQQKLISDFSLQLCRIIIIETLPSAVFADPFELQHLAQRAVFTDAAVFGDTNLELPSFCSTGSLVEVHLDVALNKSSAQNIIQEFKIEIPLHARYSPLEESGYSTVTFGVPQFLMHCKMQGGSPAQSCLLANITVSSDLKVDVVVWSVPAGIKAHAGTVSIITFISALLSAILVIIASLQHSYTASNERSKQS